MLALPASQRARVLPAAALAAAGLALPQVADARSFVIDARGSETGPGEVRAIGDFKPSRDPTLGAAIRAYGRPTRKSGGGEICRVRWARLGVQIRFQNFGGVDSCRPRNGRAQKAVVKGERPWRTTRNRCRCSETTGRWHRAIGSGST